MSSDEQPGKQGGGVPNDYGNALAWRWSRDMPTPLKRAGMLTLLYALRSMADGAGKLKFRDGKPIRIKDLAAAAGKDEKDTRRFIDAAICAGVLLRVDEPKRGRSALYILLVSPRPDWGAAVSSLEASKRKRTERKTPPWRAEENGGPPPVLTDPENGGPPPVLTASNAEGERGTAPRMSSGDRPPFGSGDRPPYYPGNSQGVSQGVAGSVTQPDSGAAPEPKTISDEKKIADERASPSDSAPPPDGFVRCAHCHKPMAPRQDGRDRHTHCRDPAAPRRRRTRKKR